MKTSTRAGSVWISRKACLGATLLAGVLDSGAALAAPIKVACVGEHTTHSDLFSNSRETQPPGMQEYPRKLQDLMGAAYDVRNFGDCCASVISGYAASETHPYVSGGNFRNSTAFVPDVVVIGSWGRHDWGLSAMTALPAFTIAKFQAGYDDLVSRYLALPNKPKIYVSTPIPILFGADGPDNGFKTSPAADAIRAVAAKYNLPIIDLYGAFFGQRDLFITPPMKDSEGEHTSDAGSTRIAQMVAAALKGQTPDAGVAPPALDGGTGADAAPANGSGGAGAGGRSVTGAASGGSSGSSGGASGTGGAAVLGTGGVAVLGTGGAASTSTGGSFASGSGGGGPSAVGSDGNSSGCACNAATTSGERAGWRAAITFVLFGLAYVLSRRSRRS